MADITINQLATQKFYQIPQIFVSRTERRKDSEGNVLMKIKHTSDYVKMTLDAKFAYGLLYNRCQLSIRSCEQGRLDFVDENGAVFLIFTVEELMELLDKSKGTVIKIKKELAEFGLLREVRMGVNKPNRLYLQLVEADHQIVEHYDNDNRLLAKFDYLGQEIWSLDDEVEIMAETLGTSGSSNFGRPKNELLEVQNLDSSNTELSKTDDDDLNIYNDTAEISEYTSNEIEVIERHKEACQKFPQHYVMKPDDEILENEKHELAELLEGKFRAENKRSNSALVKEIANFTAKHSNRTLFFLALARTFKKSVERKENYMLHLLQNWASYGCQRVEDVEKLDVDYQRAKYA